MPFVCSLNPNFPLSYPLSALWTGEQGEDIIRPLWSPRACGLCSTPCRPLWGNQSKLLKLLPLRGIRRPVHWAAPDTTTIHNRASRAHRAASCKGDIHACWSWQSEWCVEFRGRWPEVFCDGGCLIKPIQSSCWLWIFYSNSGNATWFHSFKTFLILTAKWRESSQL